MVFVKFDLSGNGVNRDFESASRHVRLRYYWRYMGVDCVVWIFPKQRNFRPTPDQFSGLANALRDGGWCPKVESPGQRSNFSELLPGDDHTKNKPKRTQPFTSDPFTPSWVEHHSEHELVLDWHVQNQKEAGVRYPFVFDPYPDSGPPFFYVRLILGREYFYWTGENVTPFDDAETKCVCGEQLAYWTGYAHGVSSQRIHYSCPNCGRNFDLTDKACEVLDGWTGEPTPLLGGLTFRFALVVDCHKYWPSEESEGRRFQLRPEFLNLWRDFVGVPFELVVTFD